MLDAGREVHWGAITGAVSQRTSGKKGVSKLRRVGEKSDPDSRLIRFCSKTPGTWARCRTCHPNNFNFAVNAWIAAISSPWEIPAISASSRLRLLNLEHLSVGRLISERQEIAVSFRKTQDLSRFHVEAWQRAILVTQQRESGRRPLATATNSFGHLALAFVRRDVATMRTSLGRGGKTSLASGRGPLDLQPQATIATSTNNILM